METLPRETTRVPGVGGCAGRMGRQGGEKSSRGSCAAKGRARGRDETAERISESSLIHGPTPADAGVMSAIQSTGGAATGPVQSFAIGVVRMEQDQQKLDGANAVALIASAGAVAPPPDFDPGVGRGIDVSG